MKKQLLFVFLLILVKISASQTITKLELQSRLSKYMVKDSELYEQIVLTDSGLKILPDLSFDYEELNKLAYIFSNDSKTTQKVYDLESSEKIGLFLQEWNFPQEKDTDILKSLKGKKIAIDPGHIGGDMSTAMAESKYLKIISGGKVYPIIEGNLTLAIALVLKEKLEKEGAIVMLTRTKKGTSVLGMSLDSWIQDSFPQFLDKKIASGEIPASQKNYYRYKTSKRTKFWKFFRKLDLEARAKKINEFEPDITFFIHLNVDASNKRNKSGWTVPTEKNFNMSFVQGSFMKSELDSLDERLDFLRILLSNEYTKSEKFSTFFINNASKNLEVSIPKNNKLESVFYLESSCLKTNSLGVYSRNLSLTRKVRGTICYGETLFMDNKNEFMSLIDSKLDFEKSNFGEKIYKISEVYFQSVIDYLQEK